jgi:hypothetical protein
MAGNGRAIRSLYVCGLLVVGLIIPPPRFNGASADGWHSVVAPECVTRLQ